MILFYLLALVPIIIGAIVFIFTKTVNLWEWLGGSLVALFLAVIFHLIAAKGMTGDIQTISGQINSAINFTAWRESYEEAVYRTETYYTGIGKNRQRHTRRVFSHWAHRTRWHSEKFIAYSNINTSYSISEAHFRKLAKNFGDLRAVRGDRKTGERNSRMIGGDPNDYHSSNTTGFIEPIAETVNFENKIKAAPSIYSFVKVPPNIPVFEWPKPTNIWETERVLGNATSVFSQREWDELNAFCGPRFKVNLIIIGFSVNDSSLLQFQEAKFLGGKKNDLVISYVGNPKNPTAVKVFGWTEQDICKRNIESFIVEHGVTKELLTFLKKEIAENYKIKDWSKFDTIDIEPAPQYYYWFLIIMLIFQGGFFFWAHSNQIDKYVKFGNIKL